MLKANSRCISNSNCRYIFSRYCRDFFYFGSREFKRVKSSISSSTHLVWPSQNIAGVLQFLFLFLFLSFGCWAQGPLWNRTKQLDTAGCSWQLRDGSKALPRKMLNVSDILNSQKCTTKHYYSPSIGSLKWTYFGRISKSQASVKCDPWIVLLKFSYQAMVVKNAVFPE